MTTPTRQAAGADTDAPSVPATPPREVVVEPLPALTGHLPSVFSRNYVDPKARQVTRSQAAGHTAWGEMCLKILAMAVKAPPLREVIEGVRGQLLIDLYTLPLPTGCEWDRTALERWLANPLRSSIEAVSAGGATGPTHAMIGDKKTQFPIGLSVTSHRTKSTKQASPNPATLTENLHNFASPVHSRWQMPKHEGARPAADEEWGKELKAPLTIEALRAKMRRAKELSGLSGEVIGERMGAREGDRKQTVNALLTRSNNPGIFTLASFAQATGLTLLELLSLPTPASEQSQNPT